MKYNLNDHGLAILLNHIPKLDINNYEYLFSVVLYFNEFDEKTKTKYGRNFKKAINNLINNFNQTYLLIKNKNMVNTFENLLFLELFEEIIEILEWYDFEELTWELKDLKLKIELGFQRYLSNNDDILILWINQENYTFKGVSEESVNSEIKMEYKFLYSLYFKYLGKKREVDFSYQSDFPKYIYCAPELWKAEFFESLFFYKKFQLVKYKKDGVILRELNDLRVAILVMTLRRNRK